MADSDSNHDEFYHPSPDVIAQAYIQSWDDVARQADDDFAGFWEDRAKEFIDWHAPWTKVLDDSNKPFFKWFVGARTNIVHNAIDRHLKTARKNKLALIWEGEKANSAPSLISPSIVKSANLPACSSRWA